MRARRPSNLSIVRAEVPPTPFDVLREHVKAEASGELICAAPGCEVHVYLQAGRLAWATDSTTPFAFTSYVLEHTSLAKETLHDLVETCRRDRLPLGPTLVAWNVLTLDEVRYAIHHQLRAAAESLSKCATGRTLFLDRTNEYAAYDARLTFDLRELVSPTTTTRLIPGGKSSVTGVLDKVRASIPPPAWLALVEGTSVLERQPMGRDDVLTSVVFERTLLDGADRVTLRTARGTVVGVALPEPGRAVWCRLEIESALGPTLTGLEPHARLGGPPSLGAAVPNEAEPTAIRALESADPSLIDVLCTFMGRAPEVDAVLVDDAGTIVGAATRREASATWMRDIVRRRMPVLRPISGDAADAESLPSMATGEDTRWCFGARLASGRTVWLFVPRETPQGLGWIYLSSLCQRIGGDPATA